MLMVPSTGKIWLQIPLQDLNCEYRTGQDRTGHDRNIQENSAAFSCLTLTLMLQLAIASCH